MPPGAAMLPARLAVPPAITDTWPPLPASRLPPAPRFIVLEARREIEPPGPCESESASIAPLLLITPPSSVSAACADISTRPSGAAIRLWFAIRVRTCAGSTEMPTSPSPEKSSVTASPAARATVPKVAVITPLLITSGASSPI